MSTKSFKNTEILYVIDAIAREKSINVDDLFSALEEVIKTTAKTQYGNSENICVRLDKKTGNVELYRSIEVVSDADFKDAEDKSHIISLKEAKKKNPDIELGEAIEDHLPPLDMSRMSAYVAKGLIVTKLKELEINKQYDQLKDRVGEIVQGMIRSIDKKGATLLIEGIECYISRSHMIRGDSFKAGDRMKAYLVKVEKAPNEIVLQLSRTHGEFLSKLMKNEVPEMQDGLIEVKSVIRDPGSRAKVAVYSPDKDIDPIGSCIGIKGSRIQAVTAELSGERIDVVRWSPDDAQYIINCFAPIQLLRIIMDEDNNNADIEVMDKDLSAVIGRQGQNIKLISKLTGVHINVNAERERNLVQESSSDEHLERLMNALDIDELLAQLLISEGYKTAASIIKAGEAKIAQIEGLDEAIAGELVLRAQEYIAQNDESEDEKAITPAALTQRPDSRKKAEDENSILMKDIRNTLAHAGITSLQAIAEMSGEELEEILEGSNLHIPRHKLDEIVMNLRNKLFFNVSNK